MEAWTIDHYARPQLANDVSVHARGSSLEIVRDGHRRIIRVDDADGARQIRDRLEELRDPASPQWLQLHKDESSGPWHDLLQRLDQWSFIEDANGTDGAAEASSGDDAIRTSWAAELLAQIDNRVPRNGRSALAREASRWLELLDDPSRASGWTDPNFYRGVAQIMLSRLRRSNPPALAVAVDTLVRLAGKDPTLVAQRTPVEWVNCYATEGARHHLSALGDLLARSLDPTAERLCRPAVARRVALSGCAFQHEAEQALRAHAIQAGPGRFVEALQRLSSARHPLVLGCHVEEFHVTRRFVEMITPLMHVDLAPPLRALVYRYFAEEVGHERFERATCLASGVDESTLDTACPLPLHLAFVDVFTQLGVLDPVAFFIAVPITEGMLGESSPVNIRIDELTPDDNKARSIFRRHEQLNIELNHASIARLALELIPVVSPELQQRALNALALAFELNFRAWEGLVDFYGDQQKLQLPQPFDSGLGRRSSAVAQR